MVKRLLKSAFSRLGYRIEGTRYVPRQLRTPELLRVLEFDDIVCRRMFDVGSSLNFVQVGVFDGVTGDPLRKYIDTAKWRGVLVEPQVSAVDKLRRLYRDNDRIAVIHAALDEKIGKRTLYTVVSDGAPTWAGGLASFERQNILKHSDIVPGLEQMIKEEIVDCITFHDVLARLSQQRVDVLQIDTEGADEYILSLFPFDKVKPAIVHWEVKHLTIVQRESCLGRLHHYGYRFAPSGGEDMMALLV